MPTKSASARKSTKKKKTSSASKKSSVSTNAKKVAGKKSDKKVIEKKSKQKEVMKDEKVLEKDPKVTSEENDLFGSFDEEPLDKADLYDEIIAKEMEKEIVKKQRKKMAGKDVGHKDAKKEEKEVVAPIKVGVIEIPEVISVKEFAEKTNLSPVKVIGELMKNGILANINQMIDYDTAQIISDDLGVKIKKKITEASAEDVFKGNLEALLKEEDPDDLEVRPPIVVVMGHVDHGKTSLLDYIREENVVKGEAGGITQHIGAYQVEKDGKKITFLDTPGHEAFTAMRARGAKVTDIAILVVAADEGVKPQTIEAIHHAQEAKVPIIVAINKIDKDGSDPDRVKGELGEFDLIPEEWGGSTIMVPVSAHTGEGIKTLLDMVLLVADLDPLKANPNRSAVGTVIEAHLDKSLGPIATVIVNSGTLNVMDNIVIGSTHGRVKVMKNYKGKNLKTAVPSTPVLIAGLSQTPQAGDIFQVVSGEKAARLQSQNVQTLQDAERFASRGVGEIISQISSGNMTHLKLVLKADTKGSLEALKQSLADIKNDDVGVKVILSGVGNVSESDVMMAAAAGGIVMGFHTKMNPNVRQVAERENIEVLQYTIIYKLLEDVTKIVSGLLEPEIIEVILGKAEIKQIFLTKKKEMIIGCKVIDGRVEKEKVRVFRGDELLGEGKIETLRKIDKVVKEVQEGNDCGMLYSGFMPLEEGDILEVYKMEKRVRTL